MELQTYAQVQAARRDHFQSSEIQQVLSESEQAIRVHHATNSDVKVDGVMYQRCGGGRRVIRKKIGGN